MKWFIDIMVIGNKTKTAVSIIVSILAIGLMLPERLIIPVQGATTQDWNHNTFWYEPWGQSGVHKGIDVFAPVDSPVISSTYGLIIYKGNIKRGGNVVAVLGPKWRIHYYAHLNDTSVHIGMVVHRSEKIGSVGNSGNAKDKPPHLHYTIFTLVPYVWRIDTATQGWKKMFFLNPSEKLLASQP